MNFHLSYAILAGALIIGTCNVVPVFVDHYQISVEAGVDGSHAIYRLNTRTGTVNLCMTQRKAGLLAEHSDNPLDKVVVVCGPPSYRMVEK